MNEVAEHTGLLPEQVSALVENMAADGFITIGPGPRGDQVSVGRALLLRSDTGTPIDAALAAALGPADWAEVGGVAGLLEALARRLGTGRGLGVPAGYDPGFFDAAYRGTPVWEVGHPQPALAELAVHNALELATLARRFDTVIDSALFHVFTDEDQQRYEAGLRQILPAGGRYFMLCFSDRQPPGFGPAG